MEVCVDNVQSFINAVEAGASRIELCSSLAEGGLTPSVGFFRQVKKIGNVQLFAFFMTIMAFYSWRKNRESLFTLKFECKIPFSLKKRKKKKTFKISDFETFNFSFKLFTFTLSKTCT